MPTIHLRHSTGPTSISKTGDARDATRESRRHPNDNRGLRQSIQEYAESLAEYGDSSTRCCMCPSSFASPRELHEHVDECVIGATFKYGSTLDDSAILSDCYDSEPSVLALQRAIAELTKSLKKNSKAKSEPTQPVTAILTAVEQSPKLFVARTISQDLSLGEDEKLALCSSGPTTRSKGGVGRFEN